MCRHCRSLAYHKGRTKQSIGTGTGLSPWQQKQSEREGIISHVRPPLSAAAWVPARVAKEHVWRRWGLLIVQHVIGLTCENHGFVAKPPFACSAILVTSAPTIRPSASRRNSPLEKYTTRTADHRRGVVLDLLWMKRDLNNVAASPIAYYDARHP